MQIDLSGLRQHELELLESRVEKRSPGSLLWRGGIGRALESPGLRAEMIIPESEEAVNDLVADARLLRDVLVQMGPHFSTAADLVNAWLAQLADERTELGAAGRRSDHDLIEGH